MKKQSLPFRLLLFEPNPPTLARLRHHVVINGLQEVVHVHDVALSDQVGTAALAAKEGNSGGAHIVVSEAHPPR